MSKATEAFERIEKLPDSYRKQKVWNCCYMIDCDIVEKELSYAEKCHNLESEIDLPLEMLVIGFKALKNGIYYKENDTISYHNVRGITEKGIEVISNICSYGECDFELSFSDYKKTWWLRKDMSE